MGVYINMEMPTAPVLFCIHPDGKVFADLEGGWREYKAIPVPPHGRLIDADALIIDLMDRGMEGMQTDDLHEIQQAVMDAPTIIPASEEGDNAD